MLNPHKSFILYLRVCTLWPTSPHSPHTPQTPTTTLLVPVSMSLTFLDSAYKWEHTVLVFLWLSWLSITPSRSIHVVQMAGFPSILWPLHISSGIIALSFLCFLNHGQHRDNKNACFKKEGRRTKNPYLNSSISPPPASPEKTLKLSRLPTSKIYLFLSH